MSIMGYSDHIKQFLNIDLSSMRPPGFLKMCEGWASSKHAAVAHRRGWKAVSQCPVCSSDKFKPCFEKFKVSIVQCTNCGLGYSTQIPRFTEDVYADESYLSEMEQSYEKNCAYRKERFGRERVALIERYLPEPHGKKLLDLGCGTGWFLECAKEAGFDIYGQELSPALAKWTSRRLNIPVWDCDLAKIPGEMTFDVMTMFDLLEHVEDPVALIRMVKVRLSPGGIIVVFTPNLDAYSISIMREHSSLIVPSEHLTYFTESSVRMLSEKAQMSIEFFCTSGIDLGDLKAYYDELNDPMMARACERLYATLQPVIDAAGAANHMRFILMHRRRSPDVSPGVYRAPRSSS